MLTRRYLDSNPIESVNFSADTQIFHVYVGFVR